MKPDVSRLILVFFDFLFFHFTYLFCSSVMIGRLMLLFRLPRDYFDFAGLLNLCGSRPILKYGLKWPKVSVRLDCIRSRSLKSFNHVNFVFLMVVRFWLIWLL